MLRFAPRPTPCSKRPGRRPSTGRSKDHGRAEGCGCARSRAVRFGAGLCKTCRVPPVLCARILVYCVHACSSRSVLCTHTAHTRCAPCHSPRFLVLRGRNRLVGHALLDRFRHLSSGRGRVSYRPASGFGRVAGALGTGSSVHLRCHPRGVGAEHSERGGAKVTRRQQHVSAAQRGEALGNLYPTAPPRVLEVSRY